MSADVNKKGGEGGGEPPHRTPPHTSRQLLTDITYGNRLRFRTAALFYPSLIPEVTPRSTASPKPRSAADSQIFNFEISVIQPEMSQFKIVFFFFFSYAAFCIFLEVAVLVSLNAKFPLCVCVRACSCMCR